jgi:hypothetical protein
MKMDTNMLNKGKRDEIIKKFLLKINMYTESFKKVYVWKKRGGGNAVPQTPELKNSIIKLLLLYMNLVIGFFQFIE